MGASQTFICVKAVTLHGQSIGASILILSYLIIRMLQFQISIIRKQAKMEQFKQFSKINRQNFGKQQINFFCIYLKNILLVYQILAFDCYFLNQNIMKSKLPLKDKNQPIQNTLKDSTPAHLKETTKNYKPVAPLVKKQNAPKNGTNGVIELKKQLKPVQLSVKVVRQQPIKSMRNESKIRQPAFMAEVKQDLFPCKQCGRSFVESSLKRHEKICKKIFINKRKEFNSAKQRVVAKEQIVLNKKNKNPIVEKPTSKKIEQIPLWKQQSMAFRIAMKEVRGGKKTEEELVYQQKQKKITNSNMFKCRFCGRNFNVESGKRHEPFCQQKAKDMMNKKKGK